jgi:hypothetical protein
MRDQFLKLSKNELVSMTELAGIRGAHKGLSKEDLVQLLEGTRVPTTDPVDELRNEVMGFIEKNRSHITLACDGNCYNHNWAKVIQCHSMFTGTKGES